MTTIIEKQILCEKQKKFVSERDARRRSSTAMAGRVDLGRPPPLFSAHCR